MSIYLEERYNIFIIEFLYIKDEIRPTCVCIYIYI